MGKAPTLTQKTIYWFIEVLCLEIYEARRVLNATPLIRFQIKAYHKRSFDG